MEILLIPAILIILGFVAVIFFLNRKLSSPKASDAALLEWVKTTQSQLDAINKTLHESINTTNKDITRTLLENSKSLNERLDNAARVISDVQKNIGEMSEIGRSMRDLQEFLNSPKLRGNIGEQVLRELLSQMLPSSSYVLQYSFKNGTIVDAVIKTDSGMIPIDSKFPMENFKKLHSTQEEATKKSSEKLFINDVKKHIDSISKKYILTSEGTLDYALMYVPSEAVYYEIVNHPNLYDYSGQKRVLCVSPVTFYAYLKAILMGLEGQKISVKAREILSGIRAIQKDYEKLGGNLDTLSRHINNSYNSMHQINTDFTKLGQKISTANQIGNEAKELPDKTN